MPISSTATSTEIFEACLYAEALLRFENSKSDPVFGRIADIEHGNLILCFEEKPQPGPGSFVLNAAHSVLEWDGTLGLDDENHWVTALPPHPKVQDRRRCPRLFAPESSLPVKAAYSRDEESEKWVEIPIGDISATGARLVPTRRFAFVLDEELWFQITIGEQLFKTKGRVIRNEPSGVAIKFTELATEIKLQANNQIQDEIKKHDNLLLERGRNLWKLRRSFSSFGSPEEHTPEQEHTLDSLCNEFEHVLSSAREAWLQETKVELELKDPHLERMKHGLYDLVIPFEVHMAPLHANLIIGLTEKAFPLFGAKDLAHTTSIFKSRLVHFQRKFIEAMHASSAADHEHPQFQVKPLKPLLEKVPTLEIFQKEFYYRMPFTTEHGEVDINLAVSGFTTQIDDRLPQEVAFDYIPELLQGQANALEEWLAKKVKCKTKKKGVVLKENLSPRFPLAALAHLEGEVHDETVVLNLTPKLVLAIDQAMTGRQAASVDQVAEVNVCKFLGMALGQSLAGKLAKSEGLALKDLAFYKSRQELMEACEDKAFLEMIYTSNQGLFELGVCLTKHHSQKKGES